MPHYRIDLERMFRFAEQLSRYDERLKTEAYRPGREWLFTYDGPIEDARDALTDILLIAMSGAIEQRDEIVSR